MGSVTLVLGPEGRVASLQCNQIVAIDFAKANERFVILGGSMGKTALDPNGVKALAALPSLDELRAKIVGLLQAPATKIAQLANAPAAKVARVIQAYASKGAAA